MFFLPNNKRTTRFLLTNNGKMVMLSAYKAESSHRGQKLFEICDCVLTSSVSNWALPL